MEFMCNKISVIFALRMVLYVNLLKKFLLQCVKCQISWKIVNDFFIEFLALFPKLQHFILFNALDHLCASFSSIFTVFRYC